MARRHADESANVAARLSSLKIAKAPKIGALPKLGVAQPKSPMSAAQKARLAHFRTAARAYFGR